MQRHSIKIMIVIALSLVLITTPVSGATVDTTQEIDTTATSTQTSQQETTNRAQSGPFPVGDADCTYVFENAICHGFSIGPENADVTLLINRNGVTLDCNPSQTDCDQFDADVTVGRLDVNPSPDNPYAAVVINFAVTINGLHVVGDTEARGFVGHITRPEFSNSIPAEVQIDEVSTDATGNLGPYLLRINIWHNDADPTQYTIEVTYDEPVTSGGNFECGTEGCR